MVNDVYDDWCDYLWHKPESVEGIRNRHLYFTLGRAVILATKDWWYPYSRTSVVDRTILKGMMNAERRSRHGE